MGHKRLDPATGRARHIAVRLTDQDRAWVIEQARARGVSAAAILRAGLALLRAPQGASPDLLVGDPPTGTAIGAHDAQRQRHAAATVGPIGSVEWARGLNILKGGCLRCPTPTGCAQEKHCDLRRRPWAPLAPGEYVP